MTAANQASMKLPSPARDAYDAALDAWEREKRIRRLWEADPALWSDADEASWLGWLHVLDDWKSGTQTLDALPAPVRAHRLPAAAGAPETPIDSVVVMGMGGSSLCPDVLSQTFGRRPGAPTLRVLDSTDPRQVRHLQEALEIDRTLFVVPSKSGSTIEPNCFLAYFFDQVEQRLGRGAAGSRFVAVTDPDTALDARAREAGFLAINHGIPSIGGRFSALSVFGMVPAALAGIDVPDFLRRASEMAEACGPDRPIRENPGASLGLLLGTLSQAGRDKLTFVISPRLASLGGWLEQLIAESTGKHGVGIVPIDGEALAAPNRYGDDRAFVYIRLADETSPEQEAGVAALVEAGFPVVSIDVAEIADLGAEFYRWEMATAVAGATLGINPFDQPDVEAAKLAARALMDEYEERGALPEPAPTLEADGLALYTPGKAAASSLTEALQQHLGHLGPGRYLAINAYLEMSPDTSAALQRIRNTVRDASRAATTVGFGPRFLHSTGQLHKGGPASGVFLQLTCDDPEDVAIPGQRYSFGVLKRAQAEGDFQVLAKRGRRIVRVHLGPDVAAGLDRLETHLGALR